MPFDGAIVYPEPWLYTRTGEHVDRWLYRGQFMTLGANFFELGRAQELLRYGVLLCLALTGISAITLARPGLRWSYHRVHSFRQRNMS